MLTSSSSHLTAFLCRCLKYQFVWYTEKIHNVWIVGVDSCMNCTSLFNSYLSIIWWYNSANMSINMSDANECNLPLVCILMNYKWKIITHALKWQLAQTRTAKIRLAERDCSKSELIRGLIRGSKKTLFTLWANNGPYTDFQVSIQPHNSIYLTSNLCLSEKIIEIMKMIASAIIQV